MAQTLSRSLLNKSALPLMWCAGCGNGIVLNALLCAMDELDLKKEKVLVVTGIGCWGKADEYITANALHVTHGRALAFATGAKAANPDLNVIVLMGDGDGTTIGGNHLIHTARRNMDLTAIIANNLNYGMTGGQYSATTPSGAITSTSIGGNPERGFDVCGLVRTAGANYVARESVSSGMRLKNRIAAGIRKKGFSLIEAMSPCSTLFGPRNKMREPVEMLRDLKEKAVSQAKFDTIENAEELGYYVAGVIADRDSQDFNARYEAEREVIIAAKGRK